MRLPLREGVTVNATKLAGEEVPCTVFVKIVKTVLMKSCLLGDTRKRDGERDVDVKDILVEETGDSMKVGEELVAVRVEDPKKSVPLTTEVVCVGPPSVPDGNMSSAI